MAVAMELATALHHSAQPAGPVVAGPREVEEQDKYEASRRQKAPPPGAHPGVLKEPEVTVGYVAAGAPSLSVVLVSDMMHDDATVQYLLKQSLLARQAELDRRKRRVEEEEKKARCSPCLRRAARPSRRRGFEPAGRFLVLRTRGKGRRGGRKRLLEPLPILRFAALIVNNGSGMCWLVLLVTILLVLCFRLLSMPVAIPQVQFLVKVICPLLSCLVVLVRKLRILRSCSPSLAVNIPFVPQTPISMVQSAQQIMEILQLPLILVVDVPVVLGRASPQVLPYVASVYGGFLVSAVEIPQVQFKNMLFSTLASLRRLPGPR